MLLAVAVTAFSGPEALSSVTRPSKRVGGSPVVPLSDPRNTPRAVEQVHLTGGSADIVHVCWASNDTELLASVVQLSVVDSGTWTDVSGGYGGIYSALQDPSPYYGTQTCKGSSNYTDPECYYTSSVLHSVELTGLTPSTLYMYRVKGDSRVFNFTTPPAAGASSIRFGVTADLGQTLNSTSTVNNMLGAVRNKSIDAVLFGGDLSYADGDHYRWDSWARMYEPLWSAVPSAHTGGNHEVSSGGENWLAYSRRFPNAHLRAGSASFLWYSFEAGPAHVVMLCSYAAFDASSAQYKWLQRDLKGVDRAKTPWLLVVLHTPWYTSNAHHPMSEGSEMRVAMEPLLLASGVDLVINGHVHAYERTHPVAGGGLAPTGAPGIPHITIGDGGNREHFALPWVAEQPSWSALREYAYGYGILMLNTTHMVWEFLRNDDPWNPPGGRVGDRAVYTKAKASALQ